jgi:ABC-2 type transport system ATP-binding protein
MNGAIETEGLARRFGRVDALDGLTLQVPAGSIFALLGPNGSGKTTTIKLLMNLLRPTRGTASVLGVDVRRFRAEHFTRIGYVSENQHLPDWMTAAELLDYVRPFYPTWDGDLCKRLAADLGLTNAARLSAMSRGTRMKAALLASLAYRPELLVLDEPFTGLDPLVRDELIRALLGLASEHPMTVFISTHDIDEVERLADWVGYLDSGRLRFAEPVPSLLNRFRRVEVIAEQPLGDLSAPDAHWLDRSTAGRTLRFVDANHTWPGAMERLASRFPGAEVHATPLSLREIFVVLARNQAGSGRES